MQTLSILRQALAIGLALAGGLATAPLAQAADAAAVSGYRFSPVNQYGINVTAAYWNPIMAYVSEKSGVPL